MSGLLSHRAVAAVLVLCLAGACASLPEGFERPESYAFADTEQTTLGRASREKRQGRGDRSGFYPLNDGLDAFVARTVLANAAERSIDAQYYLLHKDLTGRLFVDLLLKAADRGVRVRLLVDDMDVADSEFGLLAADSHPNIEIRLFNPFARNVSRASQFVTRSSEAGRRMHNKSFNVDNHYAVLGGRNIGNEYFGINPQIVFADLDVVAVGPVVRQVAKSFDAYWNSELAYPISVLATKQPSEQEVREMRARLTEYVEAQSDSDFLDALRNSNLANALRNQAVEYYWGDGEVVYDPPEKLLEEMGRSERYLLGQLSPHMQAVRDELIIFSPYFVPGKEGVAALRAVRERGVRVRILTNSLASNDVQIVHAGYLKYRKALLRDGVEIHELNAELLNEQRKAGQEGGSPTASLHAKSFVLDRESVFIGSLNLDPRAVYFNTEIGVVIQSPQLAESMARRFDERVEQVAFRLELVKTEKGSEQILWHGPVEGKPQTFDHEPHASLWERFVANFMSIFPIDGQL